MNKEVVISLQNVSKSFNKSLSLKSLLKIIIGRTSNNDLILSNINLEINEGDFVAIVGNNGVGKSTLLKLISGVLTPDSGSINTKGTINAIHELTSGFDQELKGYENLELLATLQGVSKKEYLEKLEDIISFSELPLKDLNKAIKYYSSGMKTRLAYAFNIAFVKDILLLDEVLAVGDYNFVQKCITKLKLLSKNGVTIVLVTHNINQVEGLISKIYEVKNSKIELTSFQVYGKKEKNNFFKIHPNLKLNNFTAKGNTFKVKILEENLKNINYKSIKLEKKEKVNFKLTITNSQKPINTKFYTVLSSKSPIIRYETTDYKLKTAQQTISFVVNFPELMKGDYKLDFFLIKSKDLQILMQLTFDLNTIVKEGTQHNNPSIIERGLTINT